MSYETEINRARLTKLVKDNIRQVVNNALQGISVQQLHSMIYASLLNLISQDAIKNFNVDVVDNKGHKALYETDIPVDALPGDLFIVKVDDERTGTIKEVCEGLIISSDGEGHGVVLSDPKAGDDPGVMTVKVEIKPQFPMENISIQAKWVLP